MKKTAAILVILVLLLSGCSNARDHIDRAMELRSRLLGSGCSFIAEVTADYGDKIHNFTLECTADADGNLAFTVKEPESICGITGAIRADGGYLTFDDAALQFELMADGQVTPVSAPWILLKTLRGGYLTAAGEDEGLLRVTIDDSYESDALQLDVWLDGDDIPVRADILYDGCRILSLNVSNFLIG